MAEVMADVDWQITPKTYKCRVVIERPTAEEVRVALQKLAAAGAPEHAVISFNPWNNPNDRYYMVATWEE